LEIFIFIAYLFACCFVISRVSFFRNSLIGSWSLILLFVLKIAAGIGYGLFYKLPKYYANADTWRFYRLSLDETSWLKKDPLSFIADLFTHGYSRTGNIFSGHDSYWNDLKSNIPIKLLAICNLLTNNSYYTNIILFNLLHFVGLVALFRLLKQLYESNKLVLIASIFLLPSTLFWCSGIHKDGLLLSALGLLIYLFYKGVKDGFSIKKIVAITCCFVLIFSLRNYVALVLLPALLYWWLAVKYTKHYRQIFLAIYVTGIVIFFLTPFISSSANMPGYIASKQHEFQALEGGSAVNVSSLTPTLEGFIEYFPAALDMAFLRPHPSEIKSFAFVPAIVENVLILILLLYSIYFFIRKKLPASVLFFLCFSFSLLIIAGYTITFSGAIVRYRSLAMPFLVAPLLSAITASYKKNYNS
jgi:hypothetical protein